MPCASRDAKEGRSTPGIYNDDRHGWTSYRVGGVPNNFGDVRHVGLGRGIVKKMGPPSYKDQGFTVSLMNIQATCTGTCTELLSKLNTMISSTPDISWISKDGEWPKTATALSNRLNEVIPNLAEIGLVVERQPDKHRKSDTITMTNNNYQSATDRILIAALVGKKLVDKMLKTWSPRKIAPQNRPAKYLQTTLWYSQDMY